MMLMYKVFFFFFSSRRRHTRLQGDWSSDVCSSDLDARVPQRGEDPVTVDAVAQQQPDRHIAHRASTHRLHEVGAELVLGFTSGQRVLSIRPSAESRRPPADDPLAATIGGQIMSGRNLPRLPENGA